MRTPQNRLDAAKALCLDGETADEHEAHADELDAAYAEFAAQTTSNPAPIGVTALTADVVVTSEDPE